MSLPQHISPATGLQNVSTILQLDVQKIIADYQSLQISTERFFTNIPSVEIMQCNDTGYRYYYPFTIFGDGEFYAELQKLNGDYYPTDKWEHANAINYVAPNAKVLEVGSANGYFLDRMKTKGAICTGLEFNPTALQQAKEKGLDVHNEMLDAHAQKNESTYDVVCSFQVLEHIWDVKNYFESVVQCLKPGGKCIIGVPNNNPYLYRYDVYHTLNLPPHHSGLWNKENMEKVAAYYGFKPIAIMVEKLTVPKEWYAAQVNYYLQHKSWLGKLLKATPWPLAKLIVKTVKPFTEGRNVLGIFELIKK